MATREQNCRFAVEEENGQPCRECRRCCDAARARVEELKKAQKPIPLHLAPRDGSPVIVETRGGSQVLLVQWCETGGGDGLWVSQEAQLSAISLGPLCLPITPWETSDQSGEGGS